MNVLNMLIELCCRCCPRGVGQHLGAHFDFDTSPSYWVGARLFSRQLVSRRRTVWWFAGRAVDAAVWEPTSTSIRVPAVGGEPGVSAGSSLACQQAPHCVVGLQAAQSLVCMLAARSTVRVPPWPMQRAYRPTNLVQHRPPATMTAPCSRR